MLQLLAKEGQSGAFDILAFESDNNFKKQAYEFLNNIPVRLIDDDDDKDGVTFVADLFPALPANEVQDILKPAKAQEEFIKMRCTNSNLRISGPTPDKNSLYIDRLISNRFTLNPTIFAAQSSDVFVFYAENSDDLLPYKKTFGARSAKSQLEDNKITCKHMIVENLDEWDSLLQIYTEPMHLIQVERNKLVLLRSTRGSQALNKHRAPS